MRETKKSASRLRKLLACGVVAGAASFPLVSLGGCLPPGANSWSHNQCVLPHGHDTATWGCHLYFLGGDHLVASDVAAKENIVPVVW